MRSQVTTLQAMQAKFGKELTAPRAAWLNGLLQAIQQKHIAVDIYGANDTRLLAVSRQGGKQFLAVTSAGHCAAQANRPTKGAMFVQVCLPPNVELQAPWRTAKILDKTRPGQSGTGRWWEYDPLCLPKETAEVLLRVDDAFQVAV